MNAQENNARIAAERAQKKRDTQANDMHAALVRIERRLQVIEDFISPTPKQHESLTTMLRNACSEDTK